MAIRGIAFSLISIAPRWKMRFHGVRIQLQGRSGIPSGRLLYYVLEKTPRQGLVAGPNLGSSWRAACKASFGLAQPAVLQKAHPHFVLAVRPLGLASPVRAPGAGFCNCFWKPPRTGRVGLTDGNTQRGNLALE